MTEQSRHCFAAHLVVLDDLRCSVLLIDGLMKDRNGLLQRLDNEVGWLLVCLFLKLMINSL